MFETLSDLADCLDVILADGEVEVVRIKNKLDHAYDASATAGYR